MQRSRKLKFDAYQQKEMKKFDHVVAKFVPEKVKRTKEKK